MERDGVVFIFTYGNSVNQDSIDGYHEWEGGGIAFRYHIDVGAAETLTIYPPDGYEAEPRQIQVQDGEEGVVILSPLMF